MVVDNLGCQRKPDPLLDAAAEPPVVQSTGQRDPHGKGSTPTCADCRLILVQDGPGAKPERLTDLDADIARLEVVKRRLALTVAAIVVLTVVALVWALVAA